MKLGIDILESLGYWSLLYLLPSLFPNNELREREMNLSDEEYMEAVETIFTFYPRAV